MQNGHSWICALGLLAASAGCAPAGDAPHHEELASSEAAQTRHDGETLYRGFFFQDGPAAPAFAAAFAVLKQTEASSEDPLLDQEVKSESEREQLRQRKAAAIDRLISTIRSAEPNHFSEFADAVYSGDRALLAERLDVEAAALQQYASATPVLARDLRVDAQATLSNALAIETAVVYQYVIVIDTVKAWTHFWKHDGNGVLYQEQLIDAIATHFAD